MFTGIVEELGIVTAVDAGADAASLTITCQTVLEDAIHGASIAVNGVCLTVTSLLRDKAVLAGGAAASAAWDGAALDDAALDGASRDAVARDETASRAGPAGTLTGASAFTADVMHETLARSSLGGLAPGDRVNLERPVRLSDRLGGHLVQGHVDGVGVVQDRQVAEHWEVVRVALPAGLDRYLVEKGSVTVDGVSLTVVEVTPARDDAPASFTVSLIPTTLEHTTLGHRAPGSRVNVEVDVLAKYVEKLQAGASGHSEPAPGGPVPAGTSDPNGFQR
ncbi:riboflavin synthase [Frankia sp. AiPa1]|uniref:riboflavin synthase n=1 Tax=Frankia sp. AiPa1 TaxID=573492 RepID=UPI00202B669B|nr:riboflavin synthase [Frankia sp. AiPa1]MCL9760322.1 riboflavin synthase [Frankia sp. AiPa1]